MSVFNAYMALAGKIDGKVLFREALAPHTALRIGGVADLFVVPNDYSALIRCLDVLSQENVPWVIWGKGTDVLVSDEGFRGCVISLGGEFSRISQNSGERLSVGAAVSLNKLTMEAQRASLSGLEFLVGQSGSAAGALVMGVYKSAADLSTFLSDIVVFKPHTGLKRLFVDQLRYKQNNLILEADEIIVELGFLLRPRDQKEIAQKMQDYLKTYYRLQTQKLLCSGFIFHDTCDISAAELIEKSGLLGSSIGRAVVSKTSPNCIVNEGGASAADVLKLITYMHKTVLEKTQHDLKARIRLLGFGS